MKKIGIIGAGAMGRGIAQVAAMAGCKVTVLDSSESACQEAQQSLGKIMARLVEKNKISADEAKEFQSSIDYTSRLQQISASELIIEAVVENLEVKKTLFANLEDVVSDGCVLATNTSSLSVTSLAAACRHPSRVLGLHFFNPAPLMPLVEVVSALQTDEEITKMCTQEMQDWGKVSVSVKDTPGFIVNRVARPFYGEALRIYDEGFGGLPRTVEAFATIDWAMTEIGKFRMGPFELMDFIGNDINYTVTRSVYESFFYDPRYKPSFTQKAIFEAGYFGRKSGMGYYHYSDHQAKPKPIEDSVLGQKIVDRVVAMLINEAADAHFWGIASREDIDLAMTKGVNYPKGLLAWADEISIPECVRRMDLLYEEYREDRYRCSPLLRKMAQDRRKFY